MDITLKYKNEITGTHWIEFNVSGTKDNYIHWADSSKYLNEFAFNFYTDIFEINATNFNYFGATKFDKEQLIKLKQEMSSRLKVIDGLNTLQDIIELSKQTSYVNNVAEGIHETYKNENDQMNRLKDGIKTLGLDLVQLFEDCIKHNKPLWILGL